MITKKTAILVKHHNMTQRLRLAEYREQPPNTRVLWLWTLWK